VLEVSISYFKHSVFLNINRRSVYRLSCVKFYIPMFNDLLIICTYHSVDRSLYFVTRYEHRTNQRMEVVQNSASSGC
jgi:hypothetical protein